MLDTTVFERFILKQLAGGVAFSNASHSFRLTLRNVSSRIRETIYTEGHNWEITDAAIDGLIANVINNVELFYQPNQQNIQYVDVAKDIDSGLCLRIEGSEKNYGRARLNLLFLGKSATTGNSRFMVLSSTRLGLQPEDIVEPADNTLWAVGHPVLLTVFRNGRRYPDSVRVYRTYQLDSIVKVLPSLVHEINDSLNEFSFLEQSVHDQNNESNISLSFGSNPMSLLMHEYSSLMPIYVDFDANGIGKFRSNPKADFPPSEIRDRMFNITNDKFCHNVLLLETEKPGELYIDTNSLQLMLKEPAHAKMTIKR